MADQFNLEAMVAVGAAHDQSANFVGEVHLQSALCRNRFLQRHAIEIAAFGSGRKWNVIRPRPLHCAEPRDHALVE